MDIFGYFAFFSVFIEKQSKLVKQDVVLNDFLTIKNFISIVSGYNPTTSIK